MPGQWLHYDPGKYGRSVTLSLPWPPSSNHYWTVIMRHSKSGKPAHPIVVPTNKATSYHKSVRKILESECVEKLNGHVAVDVIAHPPDRRKRDLDNLWKAINDSMHRAGLFEDDSQIYDLRIRWSGVKDERGLGFLDVTVTEIG